ncbi:heptaprenyl diphosphate synthase component 1 [Virgibacillus kimchii]
MTNSSLDIQHVKKEIKNKIKHTYLNKHIPNPEIDEEKLILLSAIINNRDMPSFQKERYIVTTMLVQIALDIHETVPVFNDQENKENKIARQLKVLAGDYYSGLYYFLLSEIEDISLTHHLAAAIKEINEHKMRMYYKEMNSFDDYIYIKHKIESILIMRVAEFLNEKTVKSIAGEWVLFQLLLREKQALNQNTPFYEAALNNYKNNLSPSLLINMQLKESIRRIRGLLEKNEDYPFFLINHIEKALAEQSDYIAFSAEEG